MPGFPPISEDLKELLSLLNLNGVEFVVVGSHALAFHGVPRFTEDIDFFVSRKRENVVRLAKALAAFGVEVPTRSIEDLIKKERGVMFVGVKPNRVDFLNFLDGVGFEDVTKSMVSGLLAGEPVWYISAPDYVKTKVASGRPKDRSDLILLEECNPDLFLD